MPFVISCSPGLAACQKLWSIPYGFRFHPAGAVTKINDLIFVVLAGWQQLHPGWLTLSAVCHSWRSPLPISKIALILRSLPPCCPPSSSLTKGQGGRIHGLAAWFSSRKGENVQSSEQMCWENSSHSPARSRWPGLVLGSWERGKRSQGNRQPTQQLTPPLISISSYSHKPNCLTFQHGSHVNIAFLVVFFKTASFCIEGSVDYAEDLAVTKFQPQVFCTELRRDNINVEVKRNHHR